MKRIRCLPSIEELKEKMPLSKEEEQARNNRICEIKDILGGLSNKKIICIGPCSADNEKAVLDYMCRLKKLQEKLKDNFLFIPRVYTSKPRTESIGYKGMLHRPNKEIVEDDIFHGIIAMREIHLKTIRETGFYSADEMLYPEAFDYISDIVAYSVVGARSVENQQHRMVASGLDIPVGMKNPTSGDISIMLNSIRAVQNKQCFIYRGWECTSEGNIYSHGILRGAIDSYGRMFPNYYYETLCDVYDLYCSKNLINPALIIDCNHCNSRKKYFEQIRIAYDVFESCKRNSQINSFIKGIMIESYIEDGNQLVGRGVYGKSVTDACLGWNKTEKLLLELAERY